MKRTTAIILGMALAAAMFFAGRGCGRSNRAPVATRTDTLIVRDTLRDTVLVPVEHLIVRVDTVFLEVPGDTVRIEVALPVERKVYAADGYRAVVEGFRPALVEMELYRTTAHITRKAALTTRPKRCGIGIQAGGGFSPKGAAPYIGIGIQYSLWTW